jgi:hypothetical protein
LKRVEKMEEGVNGAGKNKKWLVFFSDPPSSLDGLKNIWGCLFYFYFLFLTPTLPENKYLNCFIGPKQSKEEEKTV